MRQFLRRLCLASKAFADHRVAAQPRIHDLDRAWPVDELVTSAVHGRHSSLAENFFDHVATRQGGAYARVLHGDERLAVDEAERALVRVPEVALLAGFHARPPGQ